MNSIATIVAKQPIFINVFEMSGWQGAVRISRLAWNQTRSVIKPWPILYPSAILKSALRFCFLSGFCVTKWRQTLCPAIGCRHSVWSKAITISKTHFCTHLFNTHTTYCIHLTIYCHIYWKSSRRWFGSAPGHHFPKQYQWPNIRALMLWVCDSKTHQIHTFSRVWVFRIRGSTLCLQPSASVKGTICCLLGVCVMIKIDVYRS